MTYSTYYWHFDKLVGPWNVCICVCVCMYVCMYVYVYICIQWRPLIIIADNVINRILLSKSLVPKHSI
jgi:hypothetical protein